MNAKELMEHATEQEFARALEEISTISRQKQLHFMGVVSMIALAYVEEEYSACLILSGPSELQVVSCNASEIDVHEMLGQGIAMVTEAISEDRPEKMN